MMGIFVYMLKCADNSYYVGSATGDDLTLRIAQHNAGSFGGYTSSRRPVILVWSEYFEQVTDGIAAERQIKGWSRAKKEALIEGDWERVRQLARRRGVSHIAERASFEACVTAQERDDTSTSG